MAGSYGGGDAMDTSVLGLDGLKLTFVDKSGMVIGLWFTGISYGILLLQLAFYIRAKAADPILLKLAVGFFFCCDTTWNSLFVAAVYRQLVEVQPGTLEAYIPPLYFACIPLVTPFNVAGVNSFLIFRYMRLTKRRLLCYALYFVVVATLICHLWSASLYIKLRDFDITDLAGFKKHNEMAGTVAKAGLITEVIMVCLTWALLLVALLRYLQQEIMGTRLIVKKLLLMTLESGTAATAVSVSLLVYYLHHRDSSNMIILAAFMSRIYFMGMLFNLNMRGSGGQLMRDSSPDHPSQAYGTSNSLALSNIRSGTSARYQHKVIRVSQHVETEADKPQLPSRVYQLGDEEPSEYGRSTTEKERMEHQHV